ncbi:MRL1 [Symbiodinium natans]|uniref:MRL1 protein n=1 Tax=Symbiodinium natans TaxID=878477 RepID=A0A812I463_9DINO|nr:MRL1 [Symbiodinium natans]
MYPVPWRPLPADPLGSAACSPRRPEPERHFISQRWPLLLIPAAPLWTGHRREKRLRAAPRLCRGSAPETPRVTGDQCRELRELFELADTDNNGAISARELRAALRVLGIDMQLSNVRQAVAELDTNGDGEINFDEFVEACQRPRPLPDALRKAVRRGRVLSRWSALLFDSDDPQNLSTLQVAQAVRNLSDQMTEYDMDRLLGESPPKEVLPNSGGSEGDEEEVLAEVSIWGRQLWPRGARMRALHFAQLCLCEAAIVFMRWRPTAWTLALLLRWRLLVLALRPILTARFLGLLLRHRRSARALAVLLRTPASERGITQILLLDSAIADLCKDPEAPKHILRIVGRQGMGSFLRHFLVFAPPDMMRRFCQHKSTAVLLARVVRETAARDCAALVHKRRQQLPAAVALACLEPGADLWAMHFCAVPGIELWLGRFLSDPRGASFAHRVLLQPHFIDRVEDFLGFRDARAFVIRLLRQPGVYRFVTWLNRDLKMQQWFARIAKREKPMLFITEMLLEPGLDKFIVDLLLRRGNDKALRTMLDYWVHTEGSFASVFGSFSKKPGIERALARVVISPGFLDGFVFRKFLWQEGLGDLALEAAALVGVRGLVDNVLPLAFAVLVAILVFSVQGFLTEFDQPLNVESFLALFEEVSLGDVVLPFLASWLWVISQFTCRAFLAFARTRPSYRTIINHDKTDGTSNISCKDRRGSPLAALAATFGWRCKLARGGLNQARRKKRLSRLDLLTAWAACEVAVLDMPISQGAATNLVPRTPKELTQAVAEFRKRSSWAEALQLFQASLQGRLRADGIVYGAAVSACERGSRWQYSLALLTEADELTLDPGIRTLNSALVACGAGNQWCWALHVFDQARRGIHGTPNVVTYNSVISAVARADHWRLGLQLFELLTRTGLEVTEVSFTAGVAACAKGEHWVGALGILAMSRDASLETGAMTAGRNAAANACIQAGQWEEGLSIALAGTSLGFDDGSWALAVLACKAGCRWEQALFLLGAMEQAGVLPSVAACSAAIASCDREWQQALQVLATMQVRGPAPNFVVFSAAIGVCSNASVWVAALALLEDLRCRKLQAGAIPSVISSCERSGQWQRALHILAAYRDMGFHEDLASLNAALSSCAEGQRWQVAVELFRGMQAQTMQPDIISVSALTTSFGTSRWECALALGRLTRDRLESNVVSAGAAIAACQRGSQWEIALGSLQRMPQTALRPNAGACNAGLGAAERGARVSWDQALGLQQQLRRFGTRLDVVSFNAAASVCSLERRWDVALAMLRAAPEASLEAGLVGSRPRLQHRHSRL